MEFKKKCKLFVSILFSFIIIASIIIFPSIFCERNLTLANKTIRNLDKNEILSIELLYKNTSIAPPHSDKIISLHFDKQYINNFVNTLQSARGTILPAGKTFKDGNPTIIFTITNKDKSKVKIKIADIIVDEKFYINNRIEFLYSYDYKLFCQTKQKAIFK